MTRTSVQDQPAAPSASGSSFYLGMRVLPKPRRAAIYAIYDFCRVVDDIADDQTRPVAEQRRALQAWRSDLDALYLDRDPGRAAPLALAVKRYGLNKADFLAVVDGMEMDLEGIRAPDLATLDLYCDRVASAVGRLSVKVFGMDEAPGLKLSHHLGRALQLTNILRDLDEDAGIGRLYLPREFLDAEGIRDLDPAAVIQAPGIDRACRRLAAMAQEHYHQADRVLGSRPTGRLAAPRLMSAVYAKVLRQMQASGWAAPRERPRVNKAALLWILLRQGLLR